MTYTLFSDGIDGGWPPDFGHFTGNGRIIPSFVCLVAFYRKWSAIYKYINLSTDDQPVIVLKDNLI